MVGEIRLGQWSIASSMRPGLMRSHCCRTSELRLWCFSVHDKRTLNDLSPVHTSNNVEATLSNATSRTIVSTKSNVASTCCRFLATTSNEFFYREISSFRQSRSKLNMFSFTQQQCRTVSSVWASKCARTINRNATIAYQRLNVAASSSWSRQTFHSESSEL